MFERTNKSINKALRTMISDDETEKLNTIDITRIEFFVFIAFIIGVMLLPVALCREMCKRHRSNRVSKTR